MGTFSDSQRFQSGGISGPRIQSPAAFPAGLMRTPRKPCCSTRRERSSGAAGLSGLTRATPRRVLGSTALGHRPDSDCPSGSG